MADQAAEFRARLAGWIAPLAFDEKQVVLEWVERALASVDDIDRGLLVGCIDGTIEFAGVKDGDVLFRLTAAGRAQVEKILMESGEMRRYLKAIAGGAAVDEPKDPQ